MKFVTKKINKKFYYDVITGKKKCELRRDEDNIEVGDIVTMYTVNDKGKATIPIKHVHTKVTNIIKDFEGLKSGYIIWSFDILSDRQYDDIERSQMLSDIEKVSNDIKSNDAYKRILKRK